MKNNQYFNEDGSVKSDNMHYCIYHHANIFNDVCETCLVNCKGQDKRPFRSEREYMI